MVATDKKGKESMRLNIAFWLFGVTVVFGVWLGLNRVANDPKGALLEVDPRYLDIGEVFVTDEFRLTLPIKNVSTKDLEIAAMKASCRCMSVEPASLTIPTLGSSSICLVFDLTSQKPEDAALRLRPFSARLVAVIKGHPPISYPEWEVHGIVRTPLVFSPPFPEFPEDALVRGSPFKPLDVQVVSHNLLRHLAVACDDAVATVGIVLVGQKAGHYRLTVAPHENLKVGQHSFRVAFRGVTRDGQEFDGVLLRVSGTVVHDVELLPPMIPVGAVTLGETVTELVTLRSRTGKCFHVTGVRCLFGRVLAELLPEKSGPDEKRFRVTLEVSKVGPQEAVVLFEVGQESESNSREVPLHMVYFGRSKQTPMAVQNGA